MSLFITFLIGFIIHIIASKYISVFGVEFNIMLLLTIEVSLIKGSYKGEIFGFFTGIAEDIFTMGLLGERVLIRTSIGYLLGKMKGSFSVDHFLFQILITFAVFIFHSYALYLIRVIFSYSSTLSVNIWLYSLVNSLVAPFIYLILRKTDAG